MKNGKKSKLTYQSAGVDRDKADRLVEGIRRFTGEDQPATLKRKLRSSVGGYASVYALSKDQWIAATTDGVGTKLKLAFETGNHSGIGQDLVAMSVNDLICVGARPIFFLDYFATGHLDPRTGAEVIRGISRACAASGCLLVGGETAEMPGIYAEGEYDLAGFAVGTLHPKDLLPRKVRPGDVLLGIGSSGFHSNGYSLIRRLLAESAPESDRERQRLLTELLIPTALYPELVLPLKSKIKGAAHITGSGFLNVPRMNENVSYEITLPPLQERPRVFQWLRDLDAVAFSEATRTFNLGIGMVLAVSPKDAGTVLRRLRKTHRAWELGRVVRSKKRCQVRVVAEEGTAELDY